jgi:hypothetical protein
MNIQLFCAVLLGVCLGVILGLILDSLRRKKQSLFPLGHIKENTTYFFRLPIDVESEHDYRLEDVADLARNELQDCGVPTDVLKRVAVETSGVFIRVSGEPEDIAKVEIVHRLWLKGGEKK